jgi:drug/metabolite transporter (DMT)-like permease
VAIVVTVGLWAAFALSTRAIAFSSLSSWDVAFLRFLTPLVLLAPFVPRAVREVRRAPGVALASIAIGAGLPFFLLAAEGGRLGSAAFVGVIIPGVAPLVVVVLNAIRHRRKPSGRLFAAVGVLVAGITLVVLSSSDGNDLLGCTVLVLAGVLWGFYSSGLASGRLSVTSTIIVLCGPSAVVSAGVLVSGLMPNSFATAPIGEVIGFILVQGFGVGTIAGLSYGLAVRRLGPSVSSALGALSPVVVIGLALPIFGERVGVLTVGAMIVVITGVVLVTVVVRTREEASFAR